MTARRVTLAQVAAAAQVTVSTASDALRGKGRMSDATRERIVLAARSLGYVAQGSARALRSGIKPLIALHLDTPSTHGLDGRPLPFWAGFTSAFITRVQEYGYGVVVDLGVDGAALDGLPCQALVWGTTDPAGVSSPESLGFGTVVTFTVDEDAEVVAAAAGVRPLRVYHDYSAVGREVATFAREHGFCRPVTVRRRENQNYHDDIIAGFVEVMDTPVVDVDASHPETERRLVEHLQRHPETDFVFNLAAAGLLVIQAITKVGRGEVIGAPAHANGLLVMMQSELPLALARDPRLAYLSFDGVSAGWEVAENVVARLGGHKGNEVLLDATITPPGCWDA